MSLAFCFVLFCFVLQSSAASNTMRWSDPFSGVVRSIQTSLKSYRFVSCLPMSCAVISRDTAPYLFVSCHNQPCDLCLSSLSLLSSVPFIEWHNTLPCHLPRTPLSLLFILTLSSSPLSSSHFHPRHPQSSSASHYSYLPFIAAQRQYCAYYIIFIFICLFMYLFLLSADFYALRWPPITSEIQNTEYGRRRENSKLISNYEIKTIVMA